MHSRVSSGISPGVSPKILQDIRITSCFTPKVTGSIGVRVMFVEFEFPIYYIMLIQQHHALLTHSKDPGGFPLDSPINLSDCL